MKKYGEQVCLFYSSETGLDFHTQGSEKGKKQTRDSTGVVQCPKWLGYNWRCVKSVKYKHSLSLPAPLTVLSSV